MDGFRRWLEIIERVVVISAACLAAFPIYQWWNERDERRVERLASTMQMLGVCDNFFMTEDQGSLSRVDVFENLCAAVIGHVNEIEGWLLEGGFDDQR